MRHEDAEPEQNKILGAVPEARADFLPVSTGREAGRVSTAAYHLSRAGINGSELILSPVGKQQRPIDVAILGAGIDGIEPVQGRFPGISLPGLLMEVGHVLAHPYHS